MSGPGELTDLLVRFQNGDVDAANELVPLVHEELHRLARRVMSRLPAGQTMQTTALLNEAWLRIERADGAPLDGREHFMAVAAKAMRSIVVDRARRRAAERHGGGFERVELDQVVDILEQSSNDLVALDAALDDLARAKPELARVVELRFFAGMKHPEIARVLELPLRNVERAWSSARAFLYARLKEAEG